MSKVTVTREFHFRTEGRGRKRIRGGSATEPASGVPRVARLLALAIRFDELLHEGAMTDQAELARIGQVTRARVTQIMNLLNLAPEIQDQILHLPLSECCATTERSLRAIAAMSSWQKQRKAWNRQLGQDLRSRRDLRVR